MKHFKSRSTAFVAVPQLLTQMTGLKADAPIVIRCYDGEKPVFNFKNGLTNERVGDRLRLASQLRL